MSPFQYQELPTPTSIRLAHLLLTDEDKLSIVVEVAELALVTYDALSYRWGDPNDTVTVASSNGELTITRTLHEALWSLRKHHRVNVIWVDQISINQQNTVEKSRQVKRMHEIYTGAKRTWAWLGPEDKEATVALDLMPLLAKNVVSDMDRIAGLAGNLVLTDNESTLLGLPPTDSTHWTYILKFFTRPWFKRMWVVQEVCLSKNITLICGQRKVGWKVFSDAISTFKYRYAKSQGVDPAFKLARRAPKDTGPLLLCLGDCSEFEATDPKDKIYALLGLRGDLKLTVDYSKSTEEVYIDAAKAVIEEYVNNQDCIHPLQLLWTSIPNVVGKVRELPSWVPDWRGRYVSRPHDSIYMHANKGLESKSPNPTVTNDNRLVVHGFKMHTICRVDETPAQIRPLPTGTGLRRGIEFAKACGTSIVPTANSDILTTFAHTATAGRFHACTILKMDFATLFGLMFATLTNENSKIPGASEWTQLDMIRESQELMHAAKKDDIDTASFLQPSFIEAADDAALHRRFCLTEDGQLALCPMEGQAGDVFVVLCKSNFPVILRPAESGEWEHVGSGFMEGFSMGEMKDVWDMKEMRVFKIR